MRTKTKTVLGNKAAIESAYWLIDRSVWFEFTPLPDGRFEFKVKEEQAFPPGPSVA